MSRTPAIHEILDKISKEKEFNKRVELLRENDTEALRYILYYALDPNIVWALPETPPPYTKLEGHDATNVMYREAKKLFHFLEGGNPNLKQSKREQLFIQLLESVEDKDAKLLLSIKNKKMPYKGVNRQLVNTAFGFEFISEKKLDNISEVQ